MEGKVIFWDRRIEKGFIQYGDDLMIELWAKQSLDRL